MDLFEKNPAYLVVKLSILIKDCLYFPYHYHTTIFYFKYNIVIVKQ